MMPPHIRSLLAQGDSPMHAACLDYVRRRVEAADRRWAQRYDRWRESERLYRAFRPSDVNDQLRADNNLTEGVQKIVVPYGFAVLQSTLAFLMQVLTARKPRIPVEGEGPMDVRAAYLQEVVLDRQMQRMFTPGGLCWYQWLLDGLRYGLGVLKCHWTVNEFPRVTRMQQPVVHPFTGQVLGMDEQLSTRNAVVYEGNEFTNVSPFDFLPDPNEPISNFQRGEFCAQRMRRSWTLMRQRQAQGIYVGLEYVPRQPSTGSALSSVFGTGRGISDAARIADMDEVDFSYIDAQGEPYVQLVELYGMIDPQDLGLNREQQGRAPFIPSYPDRKTEGTPELWVFTLANDSRIVRAEPTDLPAMRFPFEIVEPNYDCQSPANFGMIETFRGLQYILSWLFNTRILNVEKTLNNEFVVDPSLIEEMDLLDSGPGRIIRLKEQAYMQGSKAADAIHQLNVQDVTQSHYVDSKNVMDLIQQISAANQMIQGLANPGRRAATETQAQMQMASGRMKMLLEVLCLQGFGPVAHQMAMNNQTFLAEQGIRLKPPYDRLLGMPMVQVHAGMLQGEFTFPFTDTGMPTDRLFEANTWKDLLTMMLQAVGPQALAMTPLAQMFPQAMSAILGRFLHAMNVKDLQTFGLNLPGLVVAPDEMVQQAVQAGDLVGLNPGMNGGPAVGNQAAVAPPGRANGQAPTDGFALPGMNETPGAG